MQAEVLLTLKLHQKLFANPRRITLLKQIVSTGSISQGARLAGISYKSAWDAINDMNLLAEKPLVNCATGGKGGGGAQITDYGQRLLQLYDLLAQIQQKAFDVLGRDNLPLDSLLAAISRFSLQTSARNQWFGTVERLSVHPLQPQVSVLLANSNILIKAAVTAQSAQRLELVAGKEVLVLIKAPWVRLVRHTDPPVITDNQLPGVISDLLQEEGQSELILNLSGGYSLCAMLNDQQYADLNPQPGEQVMACFAADQVVIATLC